MNNRSGSYKCPSWSCGNIPVVAVCSLSSSVLLVKDVAFVRKKLGSSGLCGCLTNPTRTRSLASASSDSAASPPPHGACNPQKAFSFNAPLRTDSYLKEVVLAVDVVHPTGCTQHEKQQAYQEPNNQHRAAAAVWLPSNHLSGFRSYLCSKGSTTVDQFTPNISGV